MELQLPHLGDFAPVLRWGIPRSNREARRGAKAGAEGDRRSATCADVPRHSCSSEALPSDFEPTSGSGSALLAESPSGSLWPPRSGRPALPPCCSCRCRLRICPSPGHGSLLSISQISRAFRAAKRQAAWSAVSAAEAAACVRRSASRLLSAATASATCSGGSPDQRC